MKLKITTSIYHAKKKTKLLFKIPKAFPQTERVQVFKKKKLTSSVKCNQEQETEGI